MQTLPSSNNKAVSKAPKELKLERRADFVKVAGLYHAGASSAAGKTLAEEVGRRRS